MKDILIVVSPAQNPNHVAIYETMRSEALKINESTRQVLETAFLVSGPKSFETAMLLYRIASNGKVPVAIFEVEGILFAPPH